MKLLIVTQKIDINDPILGFFHRWTEEFSKNCEKVTVVCLEKGEYSLPSNVTVLSLGKEEYIRSHSYYSHIFSKFLFVYRFYKYIWQERKNYDAVFVHMNQEYALLGWKLWKLLGKKIMLWRNHPYGSFLTNFAVWVSDRVFCTSKYSYTARFKKTEIMPVGIDTDFFRRKPEIKKTPNSILFLGRISPIKKPDLFIKALNLLDKDGITFKALIVGDPLPKDIGYYEGLKLKVKEYNLENKVEFIGSVKHEEAVDLYNKYELYVNLTPSGSMDKTIFEAMACESLVLVANKSLNDEIDKEFVLERESDKNIAFQLKNILSLNIKEREVPNKKLRDIVINKHSLNKLVKNLFK